MVKRIIKIISILAIMAGILGCVGFYMLAMWPNNLILADYEREFSTLEHPPDTALIATYGKVGWLELPFPETCNFLLAEARRYSSGEDEIREFYNSYGLVLEENQAKIPAFRKLDPEIEYKSEPLRVIFFERSESKSCESLISLQWSLSNVCNWATRKISQEKYFVVYVTSSGYEPGYDPRCNFAGW